MGGTYRDALGGRSLPGKTLAAFACSFWEAFPDLSFELVRTAETVAAEWLLYGTHTGWGPEVAPTGRAISLPGMDFIEVEGDKIRSVEAHFDPRQLRRTAVSPRRPRARFKQKWGVGPQFNRKNLAGK